MAGLSTIKGDFAAAEREYQAAAELAPNNQSLRIRLADFYLLTKRPDEAKRVLVDITTKAEDFLPAWQRLAEIALNEKQYDECLKYLETIRKKNPTDPGSRLLKGRMHLAKGETTDAIQELQEAVSAQPGTPKLVICWLWPSSRAVTCSRPSPV